MEQHREFRAELASSSSRLVWFAPVIARDLNTVATSMLHNSMLPRGHGGAQARIAAQ
jgi:hypothetical protein